MSHYMTALAMRQTGLKPAAKIVLYWLADHHNETTGNCFPSVARLAELCEMTRRAVQDHIDALEAAGLVKVLPRYRENGSQTSNGYALMLADAPVQNLHPPRAKFAPPPVQNLHPHNLGINNLVSEQDICAAAPKKSIRGTRLPDDWFLPLEWGNWALEYGLSQDQIRLEADRFKDYWAGVAGSKGVKIDWAGTWRNWIRNTKGRNNGNGNHSGQSIPQGRGDRVDPALANIARIVGLDQTQGDAGLGTGSFGQEI